MILTVLIGNTNTRFAWFRGRRLARSRLLPTTALSPVRLPKPGRVAGVAVASVVPGVTRQVCTGLHSVTGLEPLLVGSRTRTPLRFRYRRRDLGADRVCVAVGAWQRFPGQDTVVFDFGTATTANVILREGIFVGGTILPGIQMSLDALAATTAALPRLLPGTIRGPIQHDTRSAMRVGVAYLFAGGVERLITGIEQNTGRTFRVVATGGGAETARGYTKRVNCVFPHLASEGLAEIYARNCPITVTT